MITHLSDGWLTVAVAGYFTVIAVAIFVVTALFKGKK